MRSAYAGGPVRLHHGAGHVLDLARIGRAGNPRDARVGAEPATLTASEPAGVLGDERARLVLVELTVEVAQRLGVADRAAGRGAVTQSALHESANLVHEARSPHAVHAARDALVEDRGVHVQR